MFAQKRGTIVLKVRAGTLHHFPFHNIPGLGGSAVDSDGVHNVAGDGLDIIGVVCTELLDSPEIIDIIKVEKKTFI